MHILEYILTSWYPYEETKGNVDFKDEHEFAVASVLPPKIYHK